MNSKSYKYNFSYVQVSLFINKKSVLNIQSCKKKKKNQVCLFLMVETTEDEFLTVLYIFLLN